MKGRQGLTAISVLLLEEGDIFKSGLFQLLAREQKSCSGKGRTDADDNETDVIHSQPEVRHRSPPVGFVYPLLKLTAEIYDTKMYGASILP